jgi:hypothetical protein
MLTVSESPNAFELCPAGSVAARLARIIDLGTQQTTFNGETKRQHKVLLTWQIAENRSDGTPHQISRRFSLTLGEQSALRQFLASWRGKPFAETELQNFDLRKLLNLPCLLNVLHVERAGKQYANIFSVSPLPKSMSAPELVGPAVAFDIDDESTHHVLVDLSESLQATIEQSPEWKAHASARGHAAPAGAGTAADDGFEDDIAF